MGKIKKILENELIGGTQTADVYPVTSVKAVYDENNERLDNILNRVKQEIIYDVSARNGGAVFESLLALLSNSNLSTLIPTSVRHGGMTVRFINSTTNKYEQWRNTSDTFSFRVEHWQGIETSPTEDSHNLITSGGVKQALDNLAEDIEDLDARLESQLNGYSLRSITEEAYERLVEIGEVDDNTLYFLEEEVE